MVDEDFVMGYVCGYNDVKIAEKTITKNGTYYAKDDDADGYDPVIVDVDGLDDDKLKELIDIITGLIQDQIDEDWTGEDPPPEISPPEITVGDIRPIDPNADPLYLTSVSADGETVEVLYGVGITYNGLPAKQYCVDTYRNGVFSTHNVALIVPNGVTSRINSDGTITAISTTSSGTTVTRVYGPYVSGNSIVWSI